MAGSSCGRYAQPAPEDLIELPPGSELFVLPGRLPVGMNPDTGQAEILENDPYSGGTRRLLPPSWPRRIPPHFRRLPDQRPTRRSCRFLLTAPWAGTGTGSGSPASAPIRTHARTRPASSRSDQPPYPRPAQATPGQPPDPAPGQCCLTYGCPAARNYFLGRWEAPLPTSPSCNAACVGCISLQPSGCCPATQDRIKICPTPAEIVEIAVPHLRQAKRAIVSFGQGCEGEPLLQAETIAQGIRQIRSRTDRGTINLNSNASLPEAVERLISAGLDSIRVS